MHGLINRSIQSSVNDTYGHAQWVDATMLGNIGFENFEALLPYDDALTIRLLDAISITLDKPVEVVLEDLGTYLVSHPHLEPLRRLLRFGGVNFLEFLYSLDDLADRARLAVPDLDLPQLRLTEKGGGVFDLRTSWTSQGFGHVIVGILRAMADDYGDLVFLEYQGGKSGEEKVRVTLLETDFAEGRAFDLSAAGAGMDD